MCDIKAPNWQKKLRRTELILVAEVPCGVSNAQPPKLFFHWSLLRTKNAACEIESIFLGCGSPSQSLDKLHIYCVLTWVLHCVEDPAAKWICSARPKQETVRRPEGDLCLEWESRLSCGICLETRKVFVCVRERQGERLCAVVSLKTPKRGTCKYTDIQALLSLHLCASCSAAWGCWSLRPLNRMHDGCFQA